MSPEGVQSVCAECLRHPRLRGLSTGASVLLTIRGKGPPRCVMCGMLLGQNDESPPGREG